MQKRKYSLLLFVFIASVSFAADTQLDIVGVEKVTDDEVNITLDGDAFRLHRNHLTLSETFEHMFKDTKGVDLKDSLQQFVLGIDSNNTKNTIRALSLLTKSSFLNAALRSEESQGCLQSKELLNLIKSELMGALDFHCRTDDTLIVPLLGADYLHIGLLVEACSSLFAHRISSKSHMQKYVDKDIDAKFDQLQLVNALAPELQTLIAQNILEIDGDSKIKLYRKTGLRSYIASFPYSQITLNPDSSYFMSSSENDEMNILSPEYKDVKHVKVKPGDLHVCEKGPFIFKFSWDSVDVCTKSGKVIGEFNRNSTRFFPDIVLDKKIDLSSADTLIIAMRDDQDHSADGPDSRASIRGFTLNELGLPNIGTIIDVSSLFDIESVLHTKCSTIFAAMNLIALLKKDANPITTQEDYALFNTLPEEIQRYFRIDPSLIDDEDQPERKRVRTE
ncbi:MAG: hypothetical protein WD055_02025 [Candidatus Dependentiae bacterium]